MIKHLILLKIQNLIDVSEDLLQWFINFPIKNCSGGTVQNENIFYKELAEEFRKPIIRILIKGKYTHLL